MHAWQLRHPPPGHGSSSVGHARGCPQRLHKPHRGIQLQSTCSGFHTGQSTGCLDDSRRLAPGPAGRSNIDISYCKTAGWNPGAMTVEIDQSSWTYSVFARGNHLQLWRCVLYSRARPRESEETLFQLVLPAAHKETALRGWWGWPFRPWVNVRPQVWPVLLALHGCPGEGAHQQVLPIPYL